MLRVFVNLHLFIAFYVVFESISVMPGDKYWAVYTPM